ncbi:MAG: TraR/DksA C4-type zinc finger protein [Deltaproteobacteria bacterium]|nr:TraR/DksA C4-type zinc finger protein [Deltaproteobacteria bacterium]
MADETPWWLQDDDDVADPITEAQAEELHADLVALRVALQAQLDAPSDRAETVDLDQPIGRLSRMDAMQQQKMAQAQRGRLKMRLSQTRVGIKAWDDGDYGDCRSCGESIGYSRLKAKPESPLCVTCASSSEKR